MLLYSQNSHSQGARRLARELGIRRIRHNNSLFKGLRRPWVVNWGASAIPLPWAPLVRFLNAPRAVEVVSNKLDFFLRMFGTGLCPDFYMDINYAREELENGKTIVERHVLNGSGGRGIRIVSQNAINPEARELQEAPLYVQYIPKKAEFRIHIFDNRIIDSQQKIVRAAVRPLDWQVRNHDNGFIYQRHIVEEHGYVRARGVAMLAMRETHLHFGAVDVIYNERQDRAYVLEINTAPGLEGRTVQSYAQAIREFVQ